MTNVHIPYFVSILMMCYIALCDGFLKARHKLKVGTLGLAVTSSTTGSHVYFLLQVFWVILLFYQIVLLFDINVVLTSQQYNLTSQ